MFAGEMLEVNSGSYYNRARWMDPGAGRFLTEDPFEGLEDRPLTLRRYIYASQSPVQNTDPTGEFDLGEFNITTAADLNLRSQVAINAVGTFSSAQRVVAGLTIAAFLTASLVNPTNEVIPEGYRSFEHRGRIQIQGGDLAKSKKWRSDTPPPLQFAWSGPNSPSKARGLYELKSRWDLLNVDEQKLRARALRKAVAFIQKGPHWAPMIPKLSDPLALQSNYQNTSRIDIEIRTGVAFWN